MKLSKKFWVEAVILAFLGILIIWASKGLFRYSFYQTHDLKRQIVRGFDAVLTIREGHFPLRWAGFTNYECGAPTYNFYYPLFYYLIIIVNLFSGGVMLPIKVISFLSITIGTVFFYFWIKEETQNRLGALSSAILYLYAPYRFSLIYVRGDPEYLSYAILPAVLYFFARAFRTKNKFQFFLNTFWAATFGGFFAISHNVVSVFAMPIILLYLVAKLIQSKKFEIRKAMVIFFSFLSAFGIGSFFIFPAFLEERFTQIATPIFNYKDHFPALWQLIYSKWGYGDSAIGTALDGLSFQLGYAHWVVLGIIFVWLLYILFKRRIDLRWVTGNILILSFFVASLTFIYLMLSISIPVWEKISISKILDFPWRLLGMAVFTISALFGFWINIIQSKKIYLVVIIGITALAIIGNRNHLLAQPVLENDLPFYKSVDSLSISRRSVPAFADNILPPSAKVSCYLNTPVVSSNVKSDKINFDEFKRGSAFGDYNLEIDKNRLQGDRIILNLGYFPDMFRFYVNGTRYNYLDCAGLTCIKSSDLKEGSNEVSWSIGQTNIEKFSNYLSLIFLFGWICIIIYALRMTKSR